MVQLTVASRLHLGLLSISPTGEGHFSETLPLRRFGGAGLMVTEPSLRVSIQPFEQWQATGPHHQRALEFAKRFAQANRIEQTFQITIHQAPPEHVGLGVGTQLGLAVARGIARLMNLEDNVLRFAEQLGRGNRSAIGIYGARNGGFLIEAGKLPHESISPLIFQHPVPTDWRVLLVVPKTSGAWHGEQEHNALARLSTSPKVTDSLCRLLLLHLIPALKSGDFSSFAQGIEEYNARVGEMFAPVQGGIYSSPEIKQVVDRLKSIGAKGVGQSSWGPTVFALAPDEPTAQHWAKNSGLECLVTRVWNGEKLGENP